MCRLGVRNFRAVFYLLMLLATRWATPFLLSLADTAIFYNLDAACFWVWRARLRGEAPGKSGGHV